MGRRRRRNNGLISELDSLSTGRGLHERINDNNEWELYDEESGLAVTHAELVAKYTERANRLNAVAQVYERVDRILTNEDITVRVINDKNMDTNARSNGKDIELNANLIEDLSDESIMSLHGLNYHELAHVEFSPRQGSDLGIYVRDNKLFKAIAILEEGRAEQLLLKKYPSIRPYLEASVYTYVLADQPSDWGTKFHLITGRTYLPLEIRQSILDKAIVQYGYEIVSNVHSIIHAYRDLVFPADFDKAKELAHRLANILGHDEDSNNSGSSSSEGSEESKDSKGITGVGGGCGLPSKGRPASGKEQAKYQSQPSNDKLESLNTNRSQSDSGSGSEIETQSVNDSDSEITAKDVEVAHALNERMNQLKQDSRVKREVKDTRNAILGSGEAKADIPTGDTMEIAPSMGAISMAKRFSTELERIVRNNDPAWVGRTRSGRLNISRTMNPDVNAISEMFDQWDIGNEATDIEAVILTDNSGSMGGSMKAVCENTWILKRAIESIEGSVTAFSFDSDTELLYSKDDKAKSRVMKFVGSRGSTNPLRGIIEADRILTSSKKSIKILFIVTDGDWERQEQCDDLIKSMNNKGFLTCVVFLGDFKSYQNLIEQSARGDDRATNYLKAIRHHAKVFHAVTNTADILKVASMLVKSTLKKVA